jgi:hypothetical protein
MAHDWNRDMEPLPIKAAGVASFLRSCGRPRAAAWAAELGTELEKARAEIFNLRVDNNRLASKLARLTGGESFSQIPHSNKSEWE